MHIHHNDEEIALKEIEQTMAVVVGYETGGLRWVRASTATAHAGFE
jgi:hypothetical protein